MNSGPKPDHAPETAPTTATAAPATATGRWGLTLKTPMGEQKVTLVLDAAAAGFSGVMSNGGEENPIKDVKVSGGKLSWKADVKKPMSMTLKFDVVVDGDAMTGTFKAGMFPASPLSGVRA